MNKRQLSQTYTKYFQKFLSLTNEKTVLFHAIKKLIRIAKPLSLLDIGAGNGDLAIPISKLVKKYLAIEQKLNYVQELKINKINVTRAYFPCNIEEKFDFVLASHSLPRKKKEVTDFLNQALKILSKKGVFIAITYDNKIGDWHKMIRACGLHSRQVNKKIARLEVLRNWSNPSHQSKEVMLETFVRSKDLNNIIEALAFVYSDGDKVRIGEFEKNKKITDYLTKNYKRGQTYHFPFRHILFEIRPR